MVQLKTDKISITYAMNKWGFIGQEIVVRIAPKGFLSGESSPQILNLNQGVDMCKTRG